MCSSTLNGTDPKDPQKYVRIAVEAAMIAINESLNAVTDLAASSPSKNGTQYNTLLTCEQVLTDSLEQLNDSLSQISTLTLGSLQSEVVDVQQLLSAAMTSQDTCLTEVQDFGIWNSSDAINGTKATHATQLLSNALALVTDLTKITSLSDLLPGSHNRRLLYADHTPYRMEEEDSSTHLLGGGGAGGASYPEWMSAGDRRLLQTKPTPNAVVAQDGSGQYTTIQAAVYAARSSSASRWVIYIKAGTYSEQVNVGKNAKNLMIYGDGIGETILTGSESVTGGSTTFLSATLGKKKTHSTQIRRVLPLALPSLKWACETSCWNFFTRHIIHRSLTHLMNACVCFVCKQKPILTKCASNVVLALALPLCLLLCLLSLCATIWWTFRLHNIHTYFSQHESMSSALISVQLFKLLGSLPWTCQSETQQDQMVTKLWH